MLISVTVRPKSEMNVLSNALVTSELEIAVYVSLCKADFLIFFHMATDNDNRTQVTDYSSFYKQRIGYHLAWLISKQLNASPYLGGVHGNYPLLRKETMPAIGWILCVH